MEAILTSPYLLLAALTALVLHPLWVARDGWTSAATQLIPSLLGFSVGALAIVLAFPSNPIFKHMAEDGAPQSYYMGVVSRLVHFIMSQVVALILTFGAIAYPGALLRFVGFIGVLYAVYSAAATALSFFGAARIYNEAARPKPPSRRRRASVKPPPK